MSGPARPICHSVADGASCIGRTFALMETVLMTWVMSQRFVFDLQPAHPVELEATLTLRPKHGLHVIGQKRAT